MDINVLDRVLPAEQRASIIARVRRDQVVRLDDLMVSGQRGALTVTLTPDAADDGPRHRSAGGRSPLRPHRRDLKPALVEKAAGTCARP